MDAEEYYHSESDSDNEFFTFDEDLFGDKEGNIATFSIVDENKCSYYEFSFKKDSYVEGEEVFLCLEKYNFRESLPMEVIDNIYYQTLLLDNDKEHKYHFLIGEKKILQEDKPKSEDGLYNVVKIGEKSKPTHIFPTIQSDNKSEVDFKELMNPESLKIYLNEAKAREKIMIAGKIVGENTDLRANYSKRIRFPISSEKLDTSDGIKFIVDLPIVTTLDHLEIFTEFEKPRAILSENQENKYLVTVEYHTMNNEWSILYEKKPLDEFTPLKYYVTINSRVRAQKIRLTLHKVRNESYNPSKGGESFQKTFVYDGRDFETPGVLHWIGSKYGTASYTNPATLGLVKVLSPTSDNPASEYDKMISYVNVNEVIGISHEPAWLIIDMGEYTRVNCTSYSLRHGSVHLNSLIADWLFQGSNDMKKWDDLHSHYMTPFQEDQSTATFKTLENSEKYRYFRIFMKGASGFLNSGPDGFSQLNLGGVELYGTVYLKNDKTDSNLNSIMKSLLIDVSSIQFRRTSYLKTFEYDEVPNNGLLHYLGMNEETGVYTNPAHSGKVKVEVNSNESKWLITNKPSIIDFENYNEYSIGNGIAPVWFYIDLGEENKIRITSFVMRHGSSMNGNYIQNFRFEGSNDAKKWTTLYKEPGCPWNTPNETTNFKVEDSKEFYRFVRVYQVGSSSSGFPSLSISGVDLFGDIQILPKLTNSKYIPEDIRSIKYEFSKNEKYFLQCLKDLKENEDRRIYVEFLIHLLELNNSYLKLIPDDDLFFFLNEGIIKTTDEFFANVSAMLLKHFKKELLVDALLKSLPTLHNDIILSSSLEHVFLLIKSLGDTHNEKISKALIDIALKLGKSFNISYNLSYGEVIERTKGRGLFLELFSFTDLNAIPQSNVEDEDEDILTGNEEKIVEALNTTIEILKQNIVSLETCEPGKDTKIIESGDKLRSRISFLMRKLRAISPRHPLLQTMYKENYLSKISQICTNIFTFLSETESVNIDHETMFEISEIFVNEGFQSMRNSALLFLSRKIDISPNLPILLYSSFLSSGKTSDTSILDIVSSIKRLVTSDKYPLHHHINEFSKKLNEQLEDTQNLGSLDITLRILMELIPESTVIEKGSVTEIKLNDSFSSGEESFGGAMEPSTGEKDLKKEEEEQGEKEVESNKDLKNVFKNVLIVSIQTLNKSLDLNLQHPYYFALKVISKILSVPMDITDLFSEATSATNDFNTFISKVSSSSVYYRSITTSFLDSFFKFREDSKLSKNDRDAFREICKKAYLKETEGNLFLIDLLAITVQDNRSSDDTGLLSHYPLEEVEEKLFHFVDTHLDNMKENIKTWCSVLRIYLNFNPIEFCISGRLEALCSKIFNEEVYVRSYLSKDFKNVLVYLRSVLEIKETVTHIVSRTFFSSSNIDEMDALSRNIINFITDDVPNIIVEVSDIIKLLNIAISLIPFSPLEVERYEEKNVHYVTVHIIELCTLLVGTERYKDTHVEFNRSPNIIKLVDLILETVMKLRKVPQGSLKQTGLFVTSLIKDSLMGFLRFLLKEPESSKDVFNTISKSLEVVFSYKPLSNLFFELIEQVSFCKSYIVDNQGYKILFHSISTLASQSSTERILSDGEIDISKTVVNEDLILFSKLVKNFKAPKNGWTQLGNTFKRLMTASASSYSPYVEELFLDTGDRSIPIIFEWDTTFFLKKIHFSFVNVKIADNLVENGRIVVEAGLTEDTLRPVEIIFPESSSSYTLEVKEPVLTKFMRIIFYPTPKKFILSLHELKIWGKRDLLPDKEGGASTYPRHYISNMLRFMTIVFENDDVLDYILTLPNSRSVLSDLISILPTEDKVANILLKFVKKSKDLRHHILDALFTTDMSESKFIGYVCSFANEDSYMEKLKSKVFENMSRPRKLSHFVSTLIHTIYQHHSNSRNLNIRLNNEELDECLQKIRGTNVDEPLKKLLIQMLTVFAIKQDSIVPFVLKKLDSKVLENNETTEVVLLLLSLSSVSEKDSKLINESIPLYNVINKRITNLEFCHSILPHLLFVCVQPESRRHVVENLTNTLWNIVTDLTYSSDLRDLALKVIQNSTFYDVDQFPEKCEMIIQSTLKNSVKDPLTTMKVLSTLKEVNINLVPLEYGANLSSTLEHQISLTQPDPSVIIGKDGTISLSDSTFCKTSLFNPPISTKEITRFDFELLKAPDMNLELGITTAASAHMNRTVGIFYTGEEVITCTSSGSTVQRDYGKPFLEGQIISFQINALLKTVEIFVDGDSLGIAGEIRMNEPYHPYILLSSKSSIRLFNYTYSDASKVDQGSSYLRSEDLISYPMTSSLQELKNRVLGSSSAKQSIIFYDSNGNEMKDETLIGNLEHDKSTDIIDIYYRYLDKPSPEMTQKTVSESYHVFNYFLKSENVVSKVFDFIKDLVKGIESKDIDDSLKRRWKFYYDTTKIVLEIDGVIELIKEDLLEVILQLLNVNIQDSNSGAKVGSDNQVVLFMKLLKRTISAYKDDPWKLRKHLLEKNVLYLILLELSKTTGLLPKNRDESNSFYSSFPEQENSTQDEEKEEIKKSEVEQDQDNDTFWAKGTGFGTGQESESIFSYSDYLEKAQEQTKILIGFVEVLSFFIDDNGSEVSNKIITLLYDSCLQPVLESFLRNDSLMDMANSIDLYSELFKFLKKTASVKSFHPLLLGEGHSSIFTLLSQLQSTSTIAGKMPISKKSKKDEADSSEEELDESESLISNLINDIQKTHNVLKDVLQDLLKKEEASEGEDEFEREYTSSLSEYQFDEIDMKENEKYVHFFDSKIQEFTSESKDKMRRIVQELSVLSSSLPIHIGSSSFIRVDSERIDVMKVLITGPSGTPYENGCFLFDVFLDDNYPNGPPHFNLMTTGKGSVRFNPNLYNCGKVCLSLLGTWRGGPNEGWNKDTSTILQVIISIQSLIFVEEPYFNEPGYESTMGTEHGIRESKSYNDDIKNATLKWAFLDVLENPPLGFEEVIKIHFSLKKNVIKKQIKQWLEESTTATSKLRQEMRTLAESLLAKLKKL